MMFNNGIKAMIKPWLIAYNLLSFGAWLLFAVMASSQSLVIGKTTLIVFCVAQLLAVFDIIHAALRWVSTPLLITALQTSSRFLLLLFVYLLSSFVCSEPGLLGFKLLAVAWTVTELVRYSFYGLQLMGKKPYFLLFLRYSLFLVLYPTGVFGEMLVLYKYASLSGFAINVVNLFLVGVVVSYILFFPKLYGYMWKQRKAKLAD
jgi:very-long-chain (3R)-3-hydroxyacyl-CoA dehydratase